MPREELIPHQELIYQRKSAYLIPFDFDMRESRFKIPLFEEST